MKIPGVNDLKTVNAYLGDIASKLDKISSLSGDWEKKTIRTLERQRDIKTDLDNLWKNLGTGTASQTRIQVKQIQKLQKELEKLGSAWKNIGKLVSGEVVRAFDRFGKSLLMLGINSFERGLNELYNGIYKVWELQERWTKLLGEFRNRLGVTTKSMGALTKVAAEVEGTIYGLTNAFGQGAPMVNDFVEGLGRVETTTGGGEKALKEMIKTGVFASRVLGIGAGEAGELSFALQQMGDGLDEQKDLFLDISAGAKAAGVSTAAFGKELIQSRSFMTSFGREGRKMFMEMATFAKKLGVSLKSLEQFTKVTDTFDSTAESIARLNTVFGTSINSLELMLEQDPARRLETVRRALLSQGKTFENLSRQERNLIAETMGLSQEELAGVLKTGKTLNEVQAEQAKAREEQERSQKNLAKLINKTSTTMFAFAAAWDKVTRAITKLIRPFTDILGLTKSGEKGAKSFGQVMGGLFDRLIKFIEEVAANPEWQKFMKRLAGDAVNLAKKISAIATGPKLGDWIKTLTKGAGDFYDVMKAAFNTMISLSKTLMPYVKFILTHIKEILGAWAAMKIVQGGINVGGGIAKMSSLFAGATGGPGGAGMLGKGLLKAGKFGIGAGGGAGIGSIISSLTGGSGTGGALGGAAGGALGMLLGPMGSAAGAALGGLIGDTLEKIFSKEKHKTVLDSVLERHKTSMDAIDNRIKRSTEEFDKMNNVVFAMNAVNDARKVIEDRMLADATKRGKDEKTGKQRLIALTDEEAKVVRKRMDDAVKMKIVQGDLAALYEAMASSDGPIGMTANEMKILQKQTNEMNKLQEELIGKAMTKLELDKKEASAKLQQAMADQSYAAKRAEYGSVEENLKDIEKKKAADSSRLQELEAAASFAHGKSLEEITQKIKRLRGGISEYDKTILEQKKKLEELNALEKKKKELEEKRIKFDQAKLMLDQLMILKGKELTQALQEGADLQAIVSAGGLHNGMRIFSEQELKALKPVFEPHAQGGIVTSPTRALVGENGPEAIVPLKAIASVSSSRQPAKYGGEAARKLVNFAAAGKKSVGEGKTIKVVAGDVFLDGNLVGRHQVRSLITQDQGT